MKKEVDKNGAICFYNERGLLHREDGPAEESPNGTKIWRQNGLIHRKNGPAIEWANGISEWWQDGFRHRTDGPAVIFPDGRELYSLGSQPVSKEEFELRTSWWTPSKLRQD